jgi:hypothetical protein
VNQSKIQWVNAEVRLPEENQEVLLNINEEICLASFADKKFALKNGKTIPANKPGLKWALIMTVGHHDL